MDVLSIWVACALGFFLLCSGFLGVSANEALRIAGMGGAFVGLRYAEGAIFGNPAGLINVQDNNISAAFSAQNLDYENLSSDGGEQLNTKISFMLTPSIYYSRAIGRIGIGLGYADNLDNRGSILKVENTKAEYIVDERKFLSDTNTVFEYDFFRERGPLVSFGYSINPGLAVGVRLKYKHKVVKEGTITRPFRLTAVHDEDVNRKDATKLIPAIINNLDVGDAIGKFKEGEDSREDVVIDSSGSGLDFDIGIQTKLLASGALSAGFMLDHLIQRRIVDPQPSRVRFGIGIAPAEWFSAALDFQKSLNDKELDLNLGWEVCGEWRRWFSGGITIRSGFAREASKNKVSVGISLALGGSQWDYTLVKPLDGSPIRKAAHMLSSTTRF